MRLASSLPIALAAAAAALGGCGSDDGGSDKGEQAKPGAAVAAPEGGQRTVEIQEPPAEPERLTTRPESGSTDGIDFDAYDRSLDDMVALLEDFWTRTFKEADIGDYKPPGELIAYYPDEDDPGCGGEPAGPENAIYCADDGEDSDFVAWDEPSLFVPFYADKGDMAVGFVLAHEWGHLVQERLGISGDFRHTIEAELQADCFAGAWAGDLAEQDLLDGSKPGEGGDIDEALDAIFAVGDPPDVPFQDPTAHGTGDQRAEAFGEGFEKSLDGCAETYAPGFSEKAGSPVEPSGRVAGGDALTGAR